MVHVSGTRGELRVGYQRAAVLGAWEITPSSSRRNTFTFIAKLLGEHPVYSRESPQSLVLTLGTTEWVWEHVSVLKDGSDVYIELTERPRVIQRPQRGTP